MNRGSGYCAGTSQPLDRSSSPSWRIRWQQQALIDSWCQTCSIKISNSISRLLMLWMRCACFFCLIFYLFMDHYSCQNNIESCECFLLQHWNDNLMQTEIYEKWKWLENKIYCIGHIRTLYNCFSIFYFILKCIGYLGWYNVKTTIVLRRNPWVYETYMSYYPFLCSISSL